MAYGYKGKTNASQVAIRSSCSTSAHVEVRVSQGSEIEYIQDVVSGDGELWYEVAYNYDRRGYMMTKFIESVDKTTGKYYMIECLQDLGNKNLVKGDVDVQSSYGVVHNLQLALNKYGSYGLTVDGNFGTNTQNAVKSFQSANGLGNDGIVGPKTKGKLYYKAYGRCGWASFQ